ncbi:hypothetical protein RFI_15530 [Reticulomyxa filosa]|uniref:Uncharacterized protein n=1 Tax=Reticulomyxa filosa TaxID=46433 RepID=X6N6X0_RETFI|nr:hypothetical protein RFI_15530 [Reticulomyxa filosa]|eukprot:ETO21673.1 hypothetical protein RFI_15530 [Reticulomyxa filosa]
MNVTNLEKLVKRKCDEQGKQIDDFKDKLLDKIQTMTTLITNIQQLKLDFIQQNIEFKKQLEQCQIKFDEFEKYKQSIENRLDNQDTHIQRLQNQIKRKIEEEEEEEVEEVEEEEEFEEEFEEEEEEDEEEKDEKEDKDDDKEKENGQEQDITSFKCNEHCENILSSIKSSNLKNGTDFLLINENNQKIKLKNKEWHNYNFGVFLLGKNITLTVSIDREKNKDELGHLKIKAGHLWIKHPSSTIDCSELGYPSNQGPGKGGIGRCGGGGGYGTKGERDISTIYGKGGEIYGEETLLKEIHFGSGGGSGITLIFNYGGNGGGIIELIIEQQLINCGSIQSNGGDEWGGGGGSGGSILIELQGQSYPNKFEHTFGTITCIGGNQNEKNKGGKGRIAIYGIELLSSDIKDINPKPFNSLCK